MFDNGNRSKELDSFFYTAAIVFKTVLTEGCVAFDAVQVKDLPDSVRNCFIECMKFLRSALMPDVFEATVEWTVTLALTDTQASDSETLKLILLKRIMKYYFVYDKERFLSMCNQVCTWEGYQRCELLLK